MKVEVQCPNCGKIARVPDEHLGKKALCPKCQRKFALSASPSKAKELPEAALEVLPVNDPPEVILDAIPLTEKSEAKPKVLGTLFGRKAAEAGLIESYSVVYKGGHPDYPKEKGGGIEFNVFADHFEFLPTMGTKSWFNGLVIPFDKTYSLEIVERQLGTVEGIFGGLNSRQLNQRNNIHITYQPDQGREILLRLAMLSGITVWGQAKKCQQFLDRLRTYGIFERFRPKPSAAGGPDPAAFDIPTQIEKLAALRDKKIITEDEFARKKADLLSKM